MFLIWFFFVENLFFNLPAVARWIYFLWVFGVFDQIKRLEFNVRAFYSINWILIIWRSFYSKHVRWTIWDSGWRIEGTFTEGIFIQCTVDIKWMTHSLPQIDLWVETSSALLVDWLPFCTQFHFTMRFSAIENKVAVRVSVPCNIYDSQTVLLYPPYAAMAALRGSSSL